MNVRAVELADAHPTFTTMKTEHVTLSIEAPHRLQIECVDAALDGGRQRWGDLLARFSDVARARGVGSALAMFFLTVVRLAHHMAAWSRKQRGDWALDNPFCRLCYFAKAPVENGAPHP